MRQTALAWAAFKNMLRAAGRDPLWAFMVLVFAPFNAAKPVLQILGAISVVVGIVFVAGILALNEFGFGQGSLPRQVFDMLLMLLLLALAFRLFTTPLILHFGDDADESHGSARFATKREMTPLTQAQCGLLIGRNPKNSRLLRYDGQAHLITIAPTRSGKGVGTIIPNLLTVDRSIVCIDPKGENAAITALARQRYGLCWSSILSALRSYPQPRLTRLMILIPPAWMPLKTSTHLLMPLSLTTPGWLGKPIGTRRLKR